MKKVFSLLGWPVAAVALHLAWGAILVGSIGTVGGLAGYAAAHLGASPDAILWVCVGGTLTVMLLASPITARVQGNIGTLAAAMLLRASQT